MLLKVYYPLGNNFLAMDTKLGLEMPESLQEFIAGSSNPVRVAAFLRLHAKMDSG
jgi:hypothetical protein